LRFPEVRQMPIYAYRCSACGHAQDVLRKVSDPPLTVCPACGAPTFVKQVTAAGFQLKGSGWYVTDFRDGNKKPGKAANGDAAAKEGGSAAVSGESTTTNGADTASTAAKPAESAAAPAPAPAAAPAPAPADKGRA
jgi:putative FmdB family regulatory protein